MKIRIKGKSRHKKIIRECVKFFAEQLMSKRSLKNLVINIEVTRKFPKFTLGDAQFEDNEAWIRTYPFSNLFVMLRTMAHEMVHIKQYKKRELVELASGSTKFHDKIYDSEKVNYYYQPWEIEAMGRERGLVINFLKSKDMWTWNLMKQKEAIYLTL